MQIDKKKAITLSIGIIIGAIAGFAYWRFVGCSSGTCGITANWHTSTLMGGVFGYLISDSFVTRNKKDQEVKKAED